MRRPLLALVPALLLAACSSTPTNLEGLVWMRTSAEYQALCLQAFTVAHNQLERGLADPSWTACQEQGDVTGKPPAVIVDVDETVLDTTEYGARRLIIDTQDDDEDTFTPWANTSSCAPIPGAQAFLADAAKRGVTVFYITNRLDTVHDATRTNLQKAGFPLREDRDTVLCRTNTPDKGPRRVAVCKEFRVLLQIGDAGGDFTSAMAPRTPEERRAVATENASRWGDRWIVVPNPDYGDWLRSVLGWQEMERWERVLKEREALRLTLPVPPED